MNRKWFWGAMAAVCAATFVAYLPSIDGEFQYDDQEIAKTTWVREAGNFLDPGYWNKVDRPLTSATFALNHHIDGFKPRVWHITNVLIHLGAVVLAWRVARRLLARAGVPANVPAPAAPDDRERGKGRGKGRKAEPEVAPPGPVAEALAVAVAALFALHPLSTEAVSYISQRSEALASAFYLGGLLALLAFDAAPDGKRARFGVAAVALHFLGLGAKPMAATLPAAWLLAAAVLPASDEREDAWWERVVARLPMAAPLLLMSVYAAFSGVSGAAGSGHAGFDLDFVSPFQYVLTQLRALPIYVRLVFYPRGLNADWYFPFSRSLAEGPVLAGLAFVMAVSVAAVLAFRRFEKAEGEWAAAARMAVFGWFFFLGVLAPTTLVPLRDPFVEHRLYLATLGLVLPAAVAARAALRTLAPRPARAVAIAAALALAGGLGAATWVRNDVWASALNLWKDASTKSPQKPRIWVNLGTALHFAGRFAEAVPAYDRALALGFDPTVPVELVVRNTALALVRLRRYDEARVRLERYLAKAPRDAGTIVILALVEVDTDHLDAAEKAARTAAALDPRASRPYQILGQVNEKKGDLQGAFDAYLQASRLDPADPLPVYSMGRIEERRGKVPDACRLYARATDALARSSAARSAIEAFRRLCGGGDPASMR